MNQNISLLLLKSKTPEGLVHFFGEFYWNTTSSALEHKKWKMLQPFKHILSEKQIVLASASPRRKQILENVGLKFRVQVSDFEENLDKSSFPKVTDYVLATAQQKISDVKNKIIENGELPDIIIGADTIVEMDNVIYEKPENKDHAIEMIKGFSGRRHWVYSAVVTLVRNSDDYKEISFIEGTEVEFAELSEAVIRAYVDTGEPMDKAGGYGIQGLAGSLVSGIHGDYYNVMGFPLHKFCLHLTKFLKKM